jgi:two-component system cell cycle response regulator
MGTTGVSGTIETSHERETSRLRRARTGVLADRRLRLAALAGVGWLLLYALATKLTSGHPADQQALGNVVFPLPLALSTFLTVLAARRAVGRRRRFWSLLVAANGLWLGSEVVWSAYTYLQGHEPPFPSVVDGLYLVSYVPVPIAVLIGFGSASGRRRVGGVLDAAVAGLGLGAIGWLLLVKPQMGAGISVASLTAIAYPVLDVVVIITFVSVGLAGHRQVAPSVWLVGTAYATAALTDVVYTYLNASESYVSGNWLDLGWQLVAVLLCLAALCALRHDEGDGQVAMVGKDLAITPVLTGVVGALAVVTLEGARHGVPVTSMVIAGLVVSGLVVRFMVSVADTRQVALRLDASLREQERLAVTDGLTRLYNRRFFEEVLGLEAERATREDGALALVVLDLDHFKRVNDTHGHQSGDAVLVEVAARLQALLRGSDILARYGGEEFVIILPGADVATALEIAERCRRAVCTEPIALHSGSIVITGSFGVACLPGDTADIDTLIRYADRAMYAAKEAGRNRVASRVGAAALPPPGGQRPPLSEPQPQSEPRATVTASQ